jgi:hypothetical protein
MKRIAIALGSLWFSGAAIAWQTSNYPNAATLYQSVVSGQRSMDSLSPQERQEVASVFRAMHNVCSSNSRKCQAVCDAGNELKDASSDLMRCAGAGDYNDSCDRQFRDVRDAHDNLESAVSDAGGDCE